MLNSNSNPLGDQNQSLKETVPGKMSPNEKRPSKRATAAIRLDLKVAGKVPVCGLVFWYERKLSSEEISLAKTSVNTTILGKIIEGESV